MNNKFKILFSVVLVTALIGVFLVQMPSTVQAQESDTNTFSPPVKTELDTRFSRYMWRENTGESTYIFSLDNLEMENQVFDEDNLLTSTDLKGQLVRTEVGDNVISASKNFEDMPPIENKYSWNPQWWPTATTFTHGSVGEKNEVYFPSDVSFDEDQYAYQTDDNLWIRGRFKSIHQIDPSYSELTANVQDLNSDVPLSVENNYSVRYDDAITSTDTAFDVLYHVENYGLQKEYVMKEFSQGTQDLTWGGGSPTENHFMSFKYNMDFQHDENVEIRYRDENGDVHTWDGSSKFKATDIRYVADGEVQYVLPEPVATDNSGREFSGHYYVTSRDQNGDFVLNGHYNLDIYVNYRYGDFGDLTGTYNDKLENVRWPIKFDPAVDRTDVSKFKSLDYQGGDVLGGDAVSTMLSDLEKIPKRTDEGSISYDIDGDLKSQTSIPVSFSVDLKKKSESYFVASSILGSNSTSFTVSSSTDWESEKDTSLSENAYHRNGTLWLYEYYNILSEEGDDNADGQASMFGSTCFSGETEILMNEGSEKRAKNIQIGDEVKYYDFEENKTKTTTVTEVNEHSKEEMEYDYYLLIDNELKVTSNHPIDLSNGETVQARELEVGSKVMTVNGVREIESIEKIYEKIKTYSFRTESGRYFIDGYSDPAKSTEYAIFSEVSTTPLEDFTADMFGFDIEYNRLDYSTDVDVYIHHGSLANADGPEGSYYTTFPIDNTLSGFQTYSFGTDYLFNSSENYTIEFETVDAGGNLGNNIDIGIGGDPSYTYYSEGNSTGGTSTGYAYGDFLLIDSHPSALWVQKSHQYSSGQTIENITLDVSSLGGGLQVKVQTSNDNFSTVKDDSGWMDVTSTGTVTKTIGDISGEYMRVKYDLTKGSTPEVNSYEVDSTDANSSPDAPSNPDPSDGEKIAETTSTSLSVDVSDPDGDSMDVSFYDASDDSLIGTDSGVSDGGTASVDWGSLSGGNSYDWYAVADDGSETTQSSTWSFTTNFQPEIRNVSVDNTLIDRNVEYDSEAVGATEITVRARDNDGNSQLAKENTLFTITDGSGSEIVSKSQAESSAVVDENTKDFTFVYEPSDSMSDSALGDFDVDIDVNDTAGAVDNLTDSGTFTVSDGFVENVSFENKAGHISNVSGDWGRVTGSSSISSSLLTDNNLGDYSMGSDLKAEYETTQNGDVTLKATDGTIDGVSTTEPYTFPNFSPSVKSVSVSESLIDNNKDYGDSNAVGETTVTYTLSDPDNRTNDLNDSASSLLSIRDGSDLERVTDNEIISSRTPVDENTVEVSYTYNPGSLSSGDFGVFDTYLDATDAYDLSDSRGWSGDFEVWDLNVDAFWENLRLENVGVYGEVQRSDGSVVERDNAWIIDDVEGTTSYGSSTDNKVLDTYAVGENESHGVEVAFEYGNLDGISQVLTFKTPLLDTKPALNVDNESATLNSDYEVGSYDNMDLWFRWRENSSDTWNQTGEVNETGGGSFTESLSGLEEAETYEFVSYAETFGSPGYVEKDVTRYFTTKALPRIIDVETSSDVLDVSVDYPSLNPTTESEISVYVNDTNGYKDIKPLRLSIRDNDGGKLVDNVEIKDNTIVDENTLKFTYNFSAEGEEPTITDLRGEARDQEGYTDVLDYKDQLGNEVIELNDISTDINISDENPNTGDSIIISGEASKAIGDIGLDNVIVEVGDNEYVADFTNDAWSKKVKIDEASGERLDIRAGILDVGSRLDGVSITKDILIGSGDTLPPIDPGESSLEMGIETGRVDSEHDYGEGGEVHFTTDNSFYIGEEVTVVISLNVEDRGISDAELTASWNGSTVDLDPVHGNEYAGSFVIEEGTAPGDYTFSVDASVDELEASSTEIFTVKERSLVDNLDNVVMDNLFWILVTFIGAVSLVVLFSRKAGE